MDVDFTTVGRLLSNGGRSRMVGLLLDGDARTASELARGAGVAPSTASDHLQQLVDAGLVVAAPRGRHRDFRIAGTEVAEGLEALSRICPPVEVRSLRASSEARALHRARTCYDHVAGLLGVALADAMVATGMLEEAAGSYALGPASGEGFSALGVDVGGVARSRRPLLRACVDWTVRRPHLGGALGAALCGQYFDRGWVVRAERRRGLVVTPLGERGFERWLRIDWAALEGEPPAAAAPPPATRARAAGA
jgi:DNA-binding transcriptional ArsR family regulator